MSKKMMSSNKNKENEIKTLALNTKNMSIQEKNVNPFKVPMDHDIFALRDKEKQKKKQERDEQMRQRVHEKTTYTSRVNARTKAMIRPAGDTDDDLTDEENADDQGDMVLKDDPDFILSTTKDRHVEKEHLDDFIAKKREMFLVQYSLGVKRDEMRKLEEVAQAEEKKLELAEEYLEQDASMFDEFLKENDRNAVEAIKLAETETKAKLEKVGEIKRINAQMMAVKSEISKNEDLLREYLLYKKFLDQLTPIDIMEERNNKKEAKKAAQIAARPSSKKSLTPSRQGARKSSNQLEERSQSKASVKGTGRKISTMNAVSQPTKKVDEPSPDNIETVLSDEESDEDPELYFTSPMELLNIFQELEEQNLSLIQHSQETEEQLEEMKKTIAQTKERMNKETDLLKNQIDSLKEAIVKEQEKANELEMKSMMFSYGEFNAEDQEKTLEQLKKKVSDVYLNCIGDNEANISTLQMLTNIENRLEELFEMIEVMPTDKVEMAEKAKDKERRLRLREEKLIAQKKHQEERIKKAIERAQAEPKKKTGRRLVFRSCPPQTRKRENQDDLKQDKEEEELKYFFT